MPDNVIGLNNVRRVVLLVIVKPHTKWGISEERIPSFILGCQRQELPNHQKRLHL